MTVLVGEQVTMTTWYYILSLIVTGCGIGFIIIAFNEKSNFVLIVSLIITLIGIIGLLFLPSKRPIEKWKYTVRIEDELKCKELIDNGYTCAQLFPGENIYEIVGEELK